MLKLLQQINELAWSDQPASDSRRQIARLTDKALRDLNVPPVQPPDVRFQRTQFVVEANSHEYHGLWEDNNRRVRVHDKLMIREWQMDQSMSSETVGHLLIDGELMPTTFSTRWARLDGFLVVFYEPTSQVVDYRLIRAWFDQHCNPMWDGGTRRALADASRFGECRSALEEWKTKGL